MIKLLSSLLGLAPYAHEPEPQTAIVPAQEPQMAILPAQGRKVIPGIKVNDVAENAPQFRRGYSSWISRGISIEIAARGEFFGRGRSYSGFLRQPSGSFVLFDPARPADKILDPEILPEIIEICQEVVRLDREWIASEATDRYRDDKGNEWAKVGSNGSRS